MTALGVVAGGRRRRRPGRAARARRGRIGNALRRAARRRTRMAAAGAQWIHLVDLDAAFGRGSNRELLAAVVGQLDVAVELSGGIRDDESLGRGAGDRVPTSQRRHGCAGGSRVGARGHRDVRRPDCGRPRRPRYDVVGSWLDAGRWRALRGACPTGRRRVRALRRDRRASRRHADRAQSCSCCGRCVPPPTGPLSRAGACRRWPTCARLPNWCPLGVEGAIVGKALYAGEFTLERPSRRCRSDAANFVRVRSGNRSSATAARSWPASTSRSPAPPRRPPATRRTPRPRARSRSSARRLNEAGVGFADVIRTRIYLTDITPWEEVGRAHGEVFADIRPATSMIEVSALIDPVDPGGDRSDRVSGRRSR